jgi:5-formyltetrahydrofolate cyclo-ligase
LGYREDVSENIPVAVNHYGARIGKGGGYSDLPRPKGIYWEYLTNEQINAIPYLKQLRSSRID